MPATDPRPAGLVLAGGRGRRLGRGKAGVELGGLTLLARALAALAPHTRARWVAAPRGMTLPAGDYARADDLVEDGGPLAGLCAGLAAAGPGDVLVLGVDHALAVPALLGLLARRPPPGRPMVPEVGGRLQPLVARYPAAAEASLRVALSSGRRALVEAVAALDPERVPESELRGADPDLVSFVDVDTPEDLERARSRIEGAPR
jgi:molybdopterin-guanine dinucleotide biosynthesis protein A